MRFFNTAGPVVPDKHYHVPPLDRPLSTGPITRRTRSSSSLSVSWSRWVSRRTMSCSRAAWIASADAAGGLCVGHVSR